MNLGGRSYSPILYAGFNQNASCLSIGTKAGFKMYNCDPFGRCFARCDGGVGIAEMLFSTNIMAIVGAGEQPNSSPRRLQILNTKKNSVVCELTFPTSILAVKLNRRRLLVTLETRIYIYEISNMKLVHTIDTPRNPLAICSLSYGQEPSFIACPTTRKTSGLRSSSSGNLDPNSSADRRRGGLRSADNSEVWPQSPTVEEVHTSFDASGEWEAGAANNMGEVLLLNADTLQPLSIISAHRSPLSGLCFSNSGSVLATAGEKGTLIRVFSVPSGTKLYQFRRGTYPARIYSLAFSMDETLLGVSSETETVHVFRLSPENQIEAGIGDGARSQIQSPTSPAGSTENLPTSSHDDAKPVSSGLLQGLKGTLVRSGYLPDFVSDMMEPHRDCAFAKLPCGPGVQSVIGFNNSMPHILMVATVLGQFYEYALDLANGGEAALYSQHSFVEPQDDAPG